MNEITRALANENRCLILDWLKDPVAHFPPQELGDLEKDGVCVIHLAEKLGISQPSTTKHMKILHEAGLVKATYISQWTYYQRDRDGLKAARNFLCDLLE